MHIYEIRPRRDKRGFDLISDALPFGRLWYVRAEDAIGYAKFYSRSNAMIVRVLDESGALIETHESEGAFREF
jgi:hypothetical protein